MTATRYLDIALPRQRRIAPRHVAVRVGLPNARDDAEAVRRDGLPARCAVLPVGVSGRLLRVHPGRGQARPRHGLQRLGDCRQLRRSPVGLAHGERHDDLRLRQHRPEPGAGRGRDPAGGHRGPTGRLLAALALRCRPARARCGQRWEVPAAAARLRRRGPFVRLLHTSGNDEQPQSLGPRHHRRQRRARCRGTDPERQGLPVERARRPPAEQVRLDLRQADRHDSPGGHGVLGATRHRHRQQPRSRTRPLLHGHAQAAGHREGQALPA